MWYRETRGEEREIEVICARGGFLKKCLEREIEVCGVERREEKRER